MKTCTCCNIHKDNSQFNIDISGRGGLRAQCKECQREYYVKNREEKIKKSKEYQSKNYSKLLEYQNNYRKERDKVKRAQYMREYQIKRRNIDIQYKLTTILRNRVYRAVRGMVKGGSAIADLGCTVEFLKSHLESKWLAGMSWENWTTDGWHIDHIIPLDSFDLTNPEQFKKACHYTNLQPLWAPDNLSKSNKVLINQPNYGDIIVSGN